METKSLRSLFSVSLAHPRDLNPDRDYFHVIGADVAPVTIFSIFDMAPLSERKEQGAKCPSLQAANYSSELH